MGERTDVAGAAKQISRTLSTAASSRFVSCREPSAREASSSSVKPPARSFALRAAAERVRPGGTVTYAVCTINRAENEAVVDALGLPVDDLGALGPELRHPRRPEFLLTLPHVHGTAGFFVARVRA